MRRRLVPLVVLALALAAAGSAGVAPGSGLHLSPQAKQLSVACETAANNIESAVADASSTQTQTIQTQLRVLQPGGLVGDIAFDATGSSITVAADASEGESSCAHGAGAGQLGVGRGPGHSHIVSRLRERFSARGTYTLTFTLDRTGRDILARLGRAERAYRKHHRPGQPAPEIAWGVGLHYSPVR
jgi:hypothetical protein